MLFMQLRGLLTVCFPASWPGYRKKRFSKTVRRLHLSKGCYFCDAIYGDFYLAELDMDLIAETGERQKQVMAQNVVMGQDVPIRYSSWRYNGRDGDYEY